MYRLIVAVASSTYLFLNTARPIVIMRVPVTASKYAGVKMYLY